jgi:hypothetical protein
VSVKSKSLSRLGRSMARVIDEWEKNGACSECEEVEKLPLHKRIAAWWDTDCQDCLRKRRVFFAVITLGVSEIFRKRAQG